MWNYFKATTCLTKPLILGNSVYREQKITVQQVVRVGIIRLNAFCPELGSLVTGLYYALTHKVLGFPATDIFRFIRLLLVKFEIILLNLS